MMAWARRAKPREGSAGRSPGRTRLSPYARAWLQAACLFAGALLLGVFLGAEVRLRPSASAQPAPSDAASCMERLIQPVLVSYSFFEKDEVRAPTLRLVDENAWSHGACRLECLVATRHLIPL